MELGRDCMAEDSRSGDQAGPRPNRRRLGCWVTLILMIGVAVAIPYLAGEPNRRARAAGARIPMGMDWRDAQLQAAGRHFCFYEAQEAGTWRARSQADFAAGLMGGSNSAPGRLHLVFMGWTPRRASLFVELDPSGRVSRVTGPRGWD